jgi:hypothetical protein
VFITVLLLAAAVAAIVGLMIINQPPVERRGLLPFPESQLDYYLLDDIAGHLHRPDLRKTVSWPEHPQGRYELRTNNLGFREDDPTTAIKDPGTVRILVTGDSHIDGVLANSESFPTLLEDMLNAAAPRAAFQLLNGGTGHYGPANYLGMLRRFLDLDLDAFVIVIYTGNDLLDAVAEAWAGGTVEIPERPEHYMARLEAAQRVSSAAVSQSFNQILFFASFPELEATAIDLTVSALNEIHRVCSLHDIELRVVLLPSKFDVEPASDARVHDEITAALELDQGLLATNRRLNSSLAGVLAAMDLDSLDLAQEFEARQGELYWRRDHHLSVAGHALLAELFFERFGDDLLQLVPNSEN